ncbi:MAG: helix-turn-helix transcriptional regulator [Bacteroidales bacterium]|nr:helix-turn-helix transcriptional regulator [Bacteroidales bacterium]
MEELLRLLPSAVSIGWLFVYLIFGSGKTSFRMMSLVLLSTTFYGISEYWGVVNTLSIILIPALLWLYLQFLEKKLLSFGTAVVWTFVLLVYILAFVIGLFVDIEKYVFISEKIVIGLLYLFLMAQIFGNKRNRTTETGSVSAFVFSSGRTNPVLVQETLALFLYASVLLVDYSGWGIASVLEMIFISFFSIMGLFGEIEEISLRDISNAFSGKSSFQINVRQYGHATEIAKNARYAAMSSRDSYAVEDEYENQNIAYDYSAEYVSDAPVTVEEPKDNSSLKEKFEKEFVEGRMYLISGLTLVDLAGRLGTNKTYLSRMVNKEYGKSFTDFLSEKRIEYAKEYLLQNRYAGQVIAAQICGFPSAQSFNMTFKKLTGMTPKVWLRENQK